MRKSLTIYSKSIIFAVICFGTFLLILITVLLKLSWAEISGILFGTWAFGFTAFQIIKSNSSEKQQSLKELEEDLNNQIKETEDRLICMIAEHKKETADIDKLHDEDLKSLRQQTLLLSTIIQEHYKMKDDISRLSAALSESSKYNELLKVQHKILNRIDRLEGKDNLH